MKWVKQFLLVSKQNLPRSRLSEKILPSYRQASIGNHILKEQIE
jgi:hypothetical protein